MMKIVMMWNKIVAELRWSLESVYGSMEMVICNLQAATYKLLSADGFVRIADARLANESFAVRAYKGEDMI